MRLLRQAACIAITALQTSFSASLAAGIDVVLERRIKMPGIESRGTLTTLTDIAWNGATNQIAVGAGTVHYLVDPKSGTAIAFQGAERPSINVPIAWIRDQPLLAVSTPLETRVFTTSRSPAEKPSPFRVFDTTEPTRLVVASLSAVQLDSKDLVLLAGSNGRYPENPVVIGISVETSKRELEWSFPADGFVYYLGKTVAGNSKSGPIFVGWVHKTREADSNGREVDTHALWVIDLRTGRVKCEINVFREKPPFQSPQRGQPVLSEDGELIVLSAGWNHRMDMYVLRTSDCAQVHAQQVEEEPAYGTYAFSPNGRWLLATRAMYHGDLDRGRMSIWRTSDWSLVYDKTTSGHFTVSFDGEGLRFAAGLIGGIFIYKIIER